jgi:hypothetical protein
MSGGVGSAPYVDASGTRFFALFEFISQVFVAD